MVKLVETLNNLLQSTTKNFELVVVNDHSTDQTLKVANTLRKKYSITVLSNTLPQGKTTALQVGFAHARHPLIAIIDADNTYNPRTMLEMLEKIEQGADVVVANRKAHQNHWFKNLSHSSYQTIFSNLIHGLECDVHSGLKLFRREVLQRIKLQHSGRNFDLEFLIKAVQAGYKIASIPTITTERQPQSRKSTSELVSTFFQQAMVALHLKRQEPEIITFLPDQIKREGYGFHYKGVKFIPHTNLELHENALNRLISKQVFISILLIIMISLGLIIDWHLTLVVIVALLTLLYFSDLLFNLYLMYRSFYQDPEIKIDEKAFASISDEAWPCYTILCPLYNEPEVISQFVSAIDKLDYPKEKLQVLLLLEKDDKKTIARTKEMQLPNYLQVVIVPPSLPKTKPKACNYGLLQATGDFIVIYDAEDVPDPLQLKKAILAFNKADSQTICIQAKLNFYNPHQNFLTRFFTAEYSLWFDLILTGMQSINAPIPLGGTSNHFRTKNLQNLNGWDGFNVTEDCDLGMRLVKAGYKTAILDSTTLEEANSSLSNWIEQRSRWIKGYIQTYFVHMRRPNEFINTWSEPHFFFFQLIVGGKVLSLFINPIMWAITISYFVFWSTVGDFVESLFPTAIFYMAVFSLVFGNFLYLYYYMIGSAKREHYGIIKFVFLVPLYWLAMSVAAFKAIWDLMVTPHRWAKTKHGLHLQYQSSLTKAKTIIDNELVVKKDLSLHPQK